MICSLSDREARRFNTLISFALVSSTLRGSPIFKASISHWICWPDPSRITQELHVIGQLLVLLPNEALRFPVQQALLGTVHVPLHRVDYVLSLLLVFDVLVDLVIESLTDSLMAFLGDNFLLVRVNLRCNLHLLVVALLGRGQVAELLPEVGEVAALLLFFDRLLRLCEAALVLLLRCLGLLLRLHFLDHLVDRAIVQFGLVAAFLLRLFFLQLLLRGLICGYRHKLCRRRWRSVHEGCRTRCDDSFRSRFCLNFFRQLCCELARERLRNNWLLFDDSCRLHDLFDWWLFNHFFWRHDNLLLDGSLRTQSQQRVFFHYWLLDQFLLLSLLQFFDLALRGFFIESCSHPSLCFFEHRLLLIILLLFLLNDLSLLCLIVRDLLLILHHLSQGAEALVVVGVLGIFLFLLLGYLVYLLLVRQFLRCLFPILVYFFQSLLHVLEIAFQRTRIGRAH